MSDLRVPDLNQVMIAGRLTRDPELKYTAGNRAYARFGIANTRYYKTRDGEKREETVFASCSVWDKQAEWIAERINKGRPVLIEGSLNSYEVKPSGEEKTTTRIEIRVRHLTPLDWDVDYQTAQTSSTAQPTQPRKLIEEPVPEDDIPF